MASSEQGRLGGPFGYAIGSMSEVEGRLLVSRVIATASLERLLKHHDEKGQVSFLAALRRAIERKAKDANFDETDTMAASKYAQGLFDEVLALTKANPSVNSR
ncbi:hypothetical protein HGP16_27885 [Rhizobium sp. P40RR-XXII]|uniref:hypothetical protein n=1 Tax=Rhizobium sp. P40RR-XXII TaxID=2726739 RepID=UPI00145675B8|nr:hypothetical protein [Rhizobium sp. P40RR-XXII]NLS20355.1 hypothetical protein [Rhizobium sp. P40RR-XXII]